MTVSGHKENHHVLVVSSFCDRPEREIFCRLAKHIPISLMCDPGNPGQDKLKQAGVNIIPYSWSSTSETAPAERIANACSESSVSCVYAPRTATLAAAMKAVHESNIKIVGYRGTTGHLSIMDIGPRRTYMNRRVDKIICVSGAVARYLNKKGIPAEKLVKIHKGHDTDWYQPAKREALTDMGLPEDAFVVGFAGRVRRIKGVRHLLKALTMLRDDTNAHLVIAGDIDDVFVKCLLKKPALSQTVHLLGFSDDAPSLMGACDAFALPSIKREGLPRALIEAMSQQVPCVATDVGGIPELIEDGQSGLLVPPRNPAAIAEALRSLANDKAKACEIGRNAKQRIQQHFNVATTVEQMLALFVQ